MSKVKKINTLYDCTYSTMNKKLNTLLSTITNLLCVMYVGYVLMFIL